MKRFPQTPVWLIRAAWAACALFGVTACILVCIVEKLLEGGFPWMFCLLCVLQAGLCCAAAVISGRAAVRRWIVWTVGISAAVLSVLVLILTIFWLSFFRT
ncbi:MAG: hypothetical protein ILO68_01090 [Clostridia bacterium]|nr:hypothetical protein [Clostridia bacterium]